jgi:hypothetical protein
LKIRRERDEGWIIIKIIYLLLYIIIYNNKTSIIGGMP